MMIVLPMAFLLIGITSGYSVQGQIAYREGIIKQTWKI